MTNTNAELYASNSRSVNAFATNYKGRDIVVVNLGLLRLYGNDHDALTFVLAHELGHVKHHHVNAGQQADAFFNVVMGVAGLIFDIKQGQHNRPTAGLGRLGAEVGSTLLSRAYTRDQEREADRDAVSTLAQLGINPDAS